MKPIFKANELKEKALNKEMWMQGIYFKNAIEACFAKGAKYPKKPIDFFKRKTEESEMQEWERFKCNFVGDYEHSK